MLTTFGRKDYQVAVGLPLGIPSERGFITKCVLEMRTLNKVLTGLIQHGNVSEPIRGPMVGEFTYVAHSVLRL